MEGEASSKGATRHSLSESMVVRVLTDCGGRDRKRKTEEAKEEDMPYCYFLGTHPPVECGRLDDFIASLYRTAMLCIITWHRNLVYRMFGPVSLSLPYHFRKISYYYYYY